MVTPVMSNYGKFAIFNRASNPTKSDKISFGNSSVSERTQEAITRARNIISKHQELSDGYREDIKLVKGKKLLEENWQTFRVTCNHSRSTDYAAKFNLAEVYYSAHNRKFNELGDITLENGQLVLPVLKDFTVTPHDTEDGVAIINCKAEFWIVNLKNDDIKRLYEHLKGLDCYPPTP